MKTFIIASAMALAALAGTAVPSNAATITISEHGTRHHYRGEHHPRWDHHPRWRHHRHCYTKTVRYRHHGHWTVRKERICR